MENKINFLKSFRIFKELKDNQLQKLLYYIQKERKYVRGEKIIKQNDDGIFLISSGQVEITEDVE